jgi:hypothetical protein
MGISDSLGRDPVAFVGDPTFMCYLFMHATAYHPGCPMLFFLPFYPSIVAGFSILERLANIVKSNEAQLQQLT